MGSKFSFKDVDKGLKSIVRELSKANRPHVNVGVMSDAGEYAQFDEIKKTKTSKEEQAAGRGKAKFKKGRSHKGGINLADVATFMEFGTRSIPSRPFMKQAFDENYDRIVSFIEAQHKQVLAGTQTVEDGLKKIGVFFEGIVKQQFTKGKFKALKPATIKRKKSSRPLIDTGRLRQSITNRVVMGEEGGEA